jgi:thioredoxin-like negative regulator of GroEL
MVHGLEAEYWGRVDFVYIDREDRANAKVVQAYGVRYQPVFLFIEPDGTIIESWAGAPAEAQLRQALDDYLAAGE